jgi:hypothetical protein
MASPWATYILGPVYTLLPQRWRAGARRGSNVYLARAALLSGVLEAVLSLCLLRAWYLSYFQTFANQYAHYLRTTHSNVLYTSESVMQAGFATFAFHPLTWLILYFALEGMLRAVAALSTGEAHGTFPLFACDYLYRVAALRSKTPELPLVRDEVSTGDTSGNIRIASCRRKLDWRHPYTIRYAGTFFQVVAEKVMHRGPRPFVYTLRRLPPGSIARGLQNYDPEDVLVPVHRVQPLV